MRNFEKELPMFIGEKKKDVYLKKFSDLNDKIVGWNWCAFLLSGIWMLYRKMYLFFFGLTAISVIITMLFGELMDNQVFNLVISLALGACVGLFGDKLYYIHAKRKFDKSESYEAFIRKGGTNLLAPIIFIVIIMFLSFLGQ